TRSYGDWSSDVCSSDLSLLNFGARYMADLRGLAGGTYNYELQYTRPGETTPSSSSRGTFTLSGVNGSLTNGSAVSAWTAPALDRSEERRVGKGWRARGA